MVYPSVSTSENMKQAVSFTIQPTAYSTFNSEIWCRSPSVNLLKGELGANIIRKQIQSSDINKSDYILQKPACLPKYPSLNTLNEIVVDNSNNDKVDWQRQADPKRYIIASFRTIHSNLTLRGYST